MPENGDMSLEEINSALDAMEIGDIIAFPNGAIAHRDNDGWGITVNEDGGEMDEPGPEPTAEEIADALADIAPEMTAEERLAATREYLEEEQGQAFFSQLFQAADADEADNGGRTPQEQAFRDLLRGGQ